MPITSRRVFRLSLTSALALAGAYAMQLSLPYIAPLFAVVLTLKPAPPMGFKRLVGLLVFVMITTGVGLLLIPVLQHYPVTAILLVAVGLYLSNTLSMNKGKSGVAMLLTMGLTIISAAGLSSFAMAYLVVQSLAVGVGLAIVCQWIVYPFFPEDPMPAKPAKPDASDGASSRWLALRATLIILPAYLLALTNPSAYLSIIMKSVSLGQADSITSAKHAGRELLGSTFLGGFFAMLFWFGLKLHPNLWMFFLWMLLFSIYFSCKVYRISASRFPTSFWVNVWITLLILLGPAVQDSANGKDVYKAFAIRMSLFVAVTFYAWAAISVLERLRHRRQKPFILKSSEFEPC